MRYLTHDALTILSNVASDLQRMSQRVSGSDGVVMEVKIDASGPEVALLAEIAIDPMIRLRGNVQAQPIVVSAGGIPKDNP